MEAKDIMLAQILPDLKPINWSLLITQNTLIIILALFFIFYVIVSGVLMYHWSAYGMKSFGVIFSESLFIIVSIVLFIVASLSIFYF
jgi:cytochrome b subunit of formate dehydrogenase